MTNLLDEIITEIKNEAPGKSQSIETKIAFPDADKIAIFLVSKEDNTVIAAILDRTNPIGQIKSVVRKQIGKANITTKNIKLAIWKYATCMENDTDIQGGDTVVWGEKTLHIETFEGVVDPTQVHLKGRVKKIILMAEYSNTIPTTDAPAVTPKKRTRRPSKSTPQEAETDVKIITEAEIIKADANTKPRVSSGIMDAIQSMKEETELMKTNDPEASNSHVVRRFKASDFF
jgi:hypothetical protein